MYDAFMKLILTTADVLFKTVLKKDRNIPRGASGPCDSPVFTMINRVTDHTYQQRVPRRSSEKMLVKGASGAKVDAARLELLEHENDQLRLEVARCQRSIKRLSLIHI